MRGPSGPSQRHTIKEEKDKKIVDPDSRARIQDELNAIRTFDMYVGRYPIYQ